MTGPGTSEQWMYWKSRTPQQKNRSYALRELEKLLNGDKVRGGRVKHGKSDNNLPIGVTHT